ILASGLSSYPPRSRGQAATTSSNIAHPSAIPSSGAVPEEVSANGTRFSNADAPSLPEAKQASADAGQFPWSEPGEASHFVVVGEELWNMSEGERISPKWVAGLASPVQLVHAAPQRLALRSAEAP